MRVVFLGSPLPALQPLKFLVDNQSHGSYSVVGVVSQAAKLVGRGRKKAPQDPAVACFAKEKGLTVLQPLSARDPEFLENFERLEPDIAVTCAYGQILSSKFLSIPRRATINIHPSKLPAYRGATPVPAAILAGDMHTAVSILFTVRALDAGNIIVQKEFDIHAYETAGQLMERLFAASGPLLLEAFTKLNDPTFQGIEQDQSLVSYCKKIEKDDGKIDWQMSSQQIVNSFLAYDPWPGIYTVIGELRVQIADIRVVESLPMGLNVCEHYGSAAYCKKTELIYFKTKDSYVSVSQFKAAGSTWVSAKSFWNGRVVNRRKSTSVDERG